MTQRTCCEAATPSEVNSAFNRSVTARRNTRYDASSLWRRGETWRERLCRRARRISIRVNRKSAAFFSRGGLILTRAALSLALNGETISASIGSLLVDANQKVSAETLTSERAVLLPPRTFLGRFPGPPSMSGEERRSAASSTCSWVTARTLTGAARSARR